jgi:hypothetical protein
MFEEVVQEGIEYIYKDMFRISYIPQDLKKFLYKQAIEQYYPLKLYLTEVFHVSNDMVKIIHNYCGLW